MSSCLCDFYIMTVAAGFGNSEILELLIENGADVNATNYEDQTVLQFMIASAFSSIHPNVTELVRKVINKGMLVRGCQRCNSELQSALNCLNLKWHLVEHVG